MGGPEGGGRRPGKRARVRKGEPSPPRLGVVGLAAVEEVVGRVVDVRGAGDHDLAAGDPLEAVALLERREAGGGGG